MKSLWNHLHLWSTSLLNPARNQYLPNHSVTDTDGMVFANAIDTNRIYYVLPEVTMTH